MAVINVVAALGLTIGIMLLSLRLLRRGHLGGASRSRLHVEVIHRVPIGPRQSVGVLRIGGRVLVVSMSEQGAQVLTELEGQDRDDALAPPETSSVPFPAWLRRIPTLVRLSVLLLTVGTVVAGSAVPLAATQTSQVGTTAVTTDPIAPPSPQFDLTLGPEDGGLKISGAVGVVVMMALMTLLPALFLMMTSFTRILIVLHFLRAALGTQTTPPGQLLVAIAVMLTGVVMAPTLQDANSTALQPYLQGQLTQVEAYKAAIVPFRTFMLANTPDEELNVFADIGGVTDVQTVDDIPTFTVISSFVTSELKTAFKIGFLLFLPFTVVDLVVASVLMSMGMFMLPPVMVSLPFKLLLFVLADGWSLVMQNLVASFR
jgi:flagellar biosynthesis protein FliP